MNKAFSNPIILAVDTSSIEEAEKLVLNLRDYIGGIKIGMEFFNSMAPLVYVVLKNLVFQYFWT